MGKCTCTSPAGRDLHFDYCPMSQPGYIRELEGQLRKQKRLNILDHNARVNAQDEVTALSSAARQLTTKYDEVVSLNAALEEQAKDHKNTIQHYQLRIKELKNKLELSQQSELSFIEQIAELEERLGLLQIGYDHKTTLLASCEIALGERDAKIVNMQEIVSRSNDRIDQLAKDLLDNDVTGKIRMHAELLRLRELVEQMKVDNAELIADNNDLRAEVANMPVCKGYIENKSVSLLVDSVFRNPFPFYISGKKTEHFCNAIYIDMLKE
jgi:chromosome segregation ATPase